MIDLWAMAVNLDPGTTDSTSVASYSNELRYPKTAAERTVAPRPTSPDPAHHAVSAEYARLLLLCHSGSTCQGCEDIASASVAHDDRKQEADERQETEKNTRRENAQKRRCWRGKAGRGKT